MSDGTVATVNGRAGFREAYGAAPTALGRAPGRVNLIGEHTDYNAGLCLPIALPASAWAAVAPTDDNRLSVVSAQAGRWDGTLEDLVPGRVPGFAGYVVGALWALREAGVKVPGLEVYVDSEVPIGSGLSSSAALICAVATAVADLDPRELVAPCIRAEAEGVGAPTGGLDQTVSLLAEAGHALLLDFADGSRQQVPWQPSAAGLGLLVVDTRVRHSHSDGGYGNRRAECEAAATALGVATLREADDVEGLTDEVLRQRARHVVTEIARVRRVVAALGKSDWRAVGRAFTESHVSLRDDFEVSCPELDTVVDTALAAGALGARMTGGGFGGSAIALAAADELPALRARILAAFAERGFAEPGFLDGIPSAGAERVG